LRQPGELRGRDDQRTGPRARSDLIAGPTCYYRQLCGRSIEATLGLRHTASDAECPSDLRIYEGVLLSFQTQSLGARQLLDFSDAHAAQDWKQIRT
jgi:hypothetical protein